MTSARFKKSNDTNLMVLSTQEEGLQDLEVELQNRTLPSVNFLEHESFNPSSQLFSEVKHPQHRAFFADIIKRTQWFIFGCAEIQEMTQIMTNALVVWSPHSHLTKECQKVHGVTET